MVLPTRSGEGMLTDSQLQAIAFVIHARYGGNFAFCVDETNPAKVYFVPDGGYRADTPDSCLVRLVQEMVPICKPNWKGNPGIYFCKTGSINQMEQGMLDFAYPQCKVRADVARQMAFAHPLLELVLCKKSFFPHLQRPYANLLFGHRANYPIRDEYNLQLDRVHRVYMMAAYALLNSPKILKSYSVAAILVGPNGRIVSYGVNKSYDNLTCHAEVNALQGCLRNGIAIPAQSILYTTLEPCCMCAGMINVCMQNGVVVYNVRDTHFNGTSSHMSYHSAIPMLQLGTVKKLTTWTTGRAYNKIDKHTFNPRERLHDDLGTSINEDHQSIERSAGKRTGIITYLNKDDQKFIPEGSRALARKKEKYWFRDGQVKLNPFVQQALGEVLAFLEWLGIPVVTLQELDLRYKEFLSKHEYRGRLDYS